MKKWAFDPKNDENRPKQFMTSTKHNISKVFGVKWPFFHLQCPFIFSGDVKNQIREVIGAKKWVLPMKKWAFDPKN